MSLLKSRVNFVRRVFNSCFWSCVSLVEDDAGMVSFKKFSATIGSVDGCILR